MAKTNWDEEAATTLSAMITTVNLATKDDLYTTSAVIAVIGVAIAVLK